MLKESVKAFFKRHALLIGIIFIALGLRLMGVLNGFPFITHPDEPTVVRSALGIRFFPNPKHFDWPHLHIYLNFALYMVFSAFRSFLQVLDLRSSVENFAPIIWRDPLIFYLITRLTAVFMGALTIIPVFLAAKSLFTKNAGIWAAVVMALIPFHVWHSHYALIDVPMAFWLTWSVYFSARILTDEKPNLKMYLLAGLFIGLAASTKYNGGLAALVVALAHLFRVLKHKEPLINLTGARNVVLSGVSSVLGFLIGTPFALFDFKTFSRTDGPKGAFWQFTNVGKVGAATQIEQFFTNIFGKLMEHFGYTFLILFFVVFAYYFYLLITKKFKDHYNIWLVLIPALFFFYYISGFEKTRAQYYMIAYPFVAISVGFAINTCVNFFVSLNKLQKQLKNLLMVLFLLAIFIPPIFLIAKNNYTLMRPDTRTVLYNWLLENVQENDFLIYDSDSTEQVIEKFSKNEKKKDVRLKHLQEKSGYIIATDDGYDELFEIYTADMPEISIKVVKEIEPWYQTGPYLKIYELNKN